VCGPQRFIEDVLDGARQSGFQEEQLHREFFSVTAPEPATTDSSFHIHLERSKKTFHIPSHKTIAEVLQDNGIPVTLSCEQGVCGTCLTRLLEGDVEHRDYFQTETEKHANTHISLCCSRARSGTLVLDMKTMTFKSGTILLPLLGILIPIYGHASENGNISWPIGVNTVLNGIATQAAQTRVYNYTLHYRADRLKDGQGKNSAIPVRADIVVNALRLDRGWRQIRDNLHLVSGVVIPFADISLRIGEQKGTTRTLGNLSLKPLIVGVYNQKKTFFQQIAPLDIDIPSGSWQSNRLANAAVHYYSWQPNYGWTWLPSASIEIGGTVSAAINWRNRDTDYRSGWSMHYEQLVAVSFAEKWQLGLQGFYFRQIRDDRQGGTIVLDGYRVQGAAWGPQLRYDFTPGMAVAIKYQQEFSSRNRSQGERFWLQVTFPL